MFNFVFFFFFKQKSAYEMRISDWSSDVCSSDLVQKPYAQLIVSDGRYAYQYDPDLAQVTRRSARDSIGASPAALLFGSGSLEQAFNLQEIGTASRRESVCQYV